jgi:hypothetical protein
MRHTMEDVLTDMSVALRLTEPGRRPLVQPEHHERAVVSSLLNSAFNCD